MGYIIPAIIIIVLVGLFVAHRRKAAKASGAPGGSTKGPQPPKSQI